MLKIVVNLCHIKLFSEILVTNHITETVFGVLWCEDNVTRDIKSAIFNLIKVNFKLKLKLRLAVRSIYKNNDNYIVVKS